MSNVINTMDPLSGKTVRNYVILTVALLSLVFMAIYFQNAVFIAHRETSGFWKLVKKITDYLGEPEKPKVVPNYYQRMLNYVMR